MNRSPEAQALATRIRAFVIANGATEPFGDLALDLHRWQRAHDPVVAALTVGEPKDWREIPAIPVSLFKDLPVGTVGRDQAKVVFRTSGTTGGGRGVHRMLSDDLYVLGAFQHAVHCVPDAPGEVIALLGDPAQVPDSSLAHMVNLFTRFTAPPGKATWHVHDGVVDIPGLQSRMAAVDGPVFLAATAFALAEWLDHDVKPLPKGSVLMVTGGFKGRIHRLDGDSLYAETVRQLQPTRLVTEYGMTELSSQLWGTPDTPYVPPPWLKVVAVDPQSGRPLPAESHGQLRFYDLCNLDGTVGIETMDAGVVHANGRVSLAGRLEGAEARGCSLTVEEAWQKR